MRSRLDLILWLTLICVPAHSASGAVLIVPAQIPTIQGAIDSAAPGDTVLVQPGTYYERLYIESKNIWLVGSGPEITRLSGALASGDSLSILRLSGVDSLTVVTGFTFQDNGTSAFEVELGGAVSCDLSSGGTPTISGNRFQNNYAAYGGAISIVAYDNYAIIRNNSFVNNTAQFGGAIHTYSSTLVIESNWFEGNEATYPSISQGGAVYLGVSGTPNTLIRGNTFLGNTAGYGGGVVVQADATIDNNTFALNEKTRPETPRAAHLRVYQGFTPISVSIKNNIFAFGEGTAIDVVNAEDVVIDCNNFFQNTEGDLYTYNSSVGHGGGDFFEDPEFCGLTQGVLTLHQDSGCLPENNLICGWVGAHSVGCGATTATGDSDALATNLGLTASRSGRGVRFTISSKSAASSSGSARIAVYDLGGRELVGQSVTLSGGGCEWIWTGLDRMGRQVGAGIYYARIRSGNLYASAKCLLIN